MTSEGGKQSEIGFAEEFTTIESIFVRHRNVLAIRGKFEGIYTDYYLHLMENGLKYEPRLDRMLKGGLAVLTLHLVARPWKETIAWTVNMRAPRLNLFVTGGSLNEFITGRIFTKDVREPDRNLLYSQTLETGKEHRTSTIEVDGENPTEWIEQFYRQSEQRPGRCFELPDEEFILFAAQPDYDEEWFESLDASKAAAFLETEETKRLETRRFQFKCGCNKERILPALGSWRDRPDELFGDQAQIKVECPRCGATHMISRSDLG